MTWQELEEIDELFHGNWIDIQKRYDKMDYKQRVWFCPSPHKIE